MTTLEQTERIIEESSAWMEKEHAELRQKYKKRLEELSENAEEISEGPTSDRTITITLSVTERESVDNAEEVLIWKGVTELHERDEINWEQEQHMIVNLLRDAGKNIHRLTKRSVHLQQKVRRLDRVKGNDDI